MKAAILWLMILVAAVTGYIFFKMLGWREQTRRLPQPQHVQVDYAKLAQDRNLGPREFVLTDQDGNLFTSDELRGKVWVLSFFFKNCAKECLELNRKLADLQQAIPNADVHFVSISCNPEIDTPQELQMYRQGFRGDPLRWHMLTGNFNYIDEKIAKPLQLTYKRSDHTQRVVIFGRDGLPKEYLALLPETDTEKTEAFERAKKRITELLAEAAPADPAKADKVPEQKSAEQKPAEKAAPMAEVVQ
jgi:cytochrome oxidase Cu insertion factor (SCO1/SenC/PrrC family)